MKLRGFLYCIFRTISVHFLACYEAVSKRYCDAFYMAVGAHKFAFYQTLNYRANEGKGKLA